MVRKKGRSLGAGTEEGYEMTIGLTEEGVLLTAATSRYVVHIR